MDPSRPHLTKTGTRRFVNAPFLDATRSRFPQLFHPNPATGGVTYRDDTPPRDPDGDIEIVPQNDGTFEVKVKAQFGDMIDWLVVNAMAHGCYAAITFTDLGKTVSLG